MSSQTDQQPAAPVWAQPQPGPSAAPASPVNPGPSASSASPANLGPSAAPARSSSKIKTIVVGVVAALVIGGGGFAVVKAASGDSSSTSQQAGPGGTGGFGGNGPGGPGGFGGGMGGNGLSGALHGDFTASDGNGGYTTKRLQTGTVTEISTTSITAKSADGHATTFVIGSSTTVDNGNDQVSDIKTGDTVTVVGAVDGSTATATTITDTTLNQASGQNGQPDGNGGQPPAN
ncbi:hypothetical protein [Dactylosporangium sp. CA-233914]|uniref:hypothetical protein n=1 Tax=Dactylosporangium sp. CA-233914 TaxID=3239934 RepID=UPI003D8A3423